MASISFHRIDENEKLTKEQADEFKSGLVRFNHIAESVKLGGIVGASVMGASVLIDCYYGRRRGRGVTGPTESSNLIDPTPDQR